eukprot:scaffold1824_cov104-Skeletonema_dohrnii-CCMP3373.AAC.7
MSTEEEFDPFSLLGPPAPIMSSENKVKVEEGLSLNRLLRKHKANVANVQALIGKYPDEVMKRDGRHDEKYLPLHTALMYHASVEVVMLLIDAYPEAAKEDNALHLAIQRDRSKSENLLSVVKALLDIYPEGAKKRGDNGRLPLTSSLIYEYGRRDDEVLAILAAYPQAAEDKQVDLSDSAESETLQEGDQLLLLNNKPAKVALHDAIMEMRSHQVLKALLDAYPDAAKKKNPQTGNLPLHDALGRAEEVILLLLNAYPQAAKEKMKDGRLPIEVCAKNKASKDLMLALYKANPKSRVEGLLFLGIVLTDGLSDDVVLAVLQAYPEAAKETFSTKSDVCILPLHIAHEEKRSEEVKKALLDAYPRAKEVENPFETTLRLHKLLEDTSPDEDVLEDLIEKYPDAVGKRGGDGRLPLHIALVHKASQDVIMMLFRKYPQAAKERMEDSRLPIQVCAERNMSKDLMLSLLEDDMPISKDGMRVENCGSWFRCVSYNTEGAIGAVRCILSKNAWWEDDFFCNHIHVLADVCDDQGRTALNLAAKGPRAVINEYLLFCGRYKLKSGPPEHHTATSVILRAQDLDEKADYDAIFEEADDNGNGKLDRKELKAITVKIGLDPDLFLKGSKESDESISKETFVGICKQLLGDGPREVVIKLMKNKDHWKRERNAREEYNLSQKYVVSTLPNAPSDTEIDKAVETGRGGLKTIQDKFLKDIVLGKYAIVMGAGPRNLLQIFYQEQPKIDDVRHILKQVFEAVKHLHEKKLMHGDIKMLNIIRLGIDNKLRLIDFDASARIVPQGGEEESFAGAGAKFSSAVLPPEMIDRLVTEEQLEKFKKYWESEIDADLKKKVAPKLYKKQGTVKARYVVKSFRTEEGKPATPVFEGLPYEDEELVRASESIDLWSLGVLAFTLLTGESLIPSTRDDDCASGNAMHVLYYWGTQPEALSELFNKIQFDAARDLVQQLLQYEPGKRPSAASLLENHPFFNQQSVVLLKTLNDLRTNQEDAEKHRQDDRAVMARIDANVVVIKKLATESKDELRRTRHALLRGIFEATEVRTPTTFIILNNELPPEPSDVDRKKMLDFITNEDGSGFSVTTKQATLTATAEGVNIGLEGDLKEYRDQVEAGIKWANKIKDIGTNVLAGEIGTAFDIIKDGIEDLIVGNEMYLYLVDELTGEPVRAQGWPIVITKPSDRVHNWLPLMQLGMRAMSIYNGTAGLARLFGYPFPKVPKEWSKGAQETVELLKQESSVEEFSVLHEEVKGEGSSEENKSVRGASLRDFVDFLEKEDPGRNFAGLNRIGDPEEGTALWTMLTDPGDIDRKLEERRRQRKEEDQRAHNVLNRKTAKKDIELEEENNERISDVESVMISKETKTNQIRNTPKDIVTGEVGTRNIVVASEEIVELTKAAKEATASAKEATAAAKEATAAAKDIANAAGKACCAIM